MAVWLYGCVSVYGCMSVCRCVQVFVDNVSGDTLSVTRHNPVSHQSVILIARTAFSHPHHLDPRGVPNVNVPGQHTCL